MEYFSHFLRQARTPLAGVRQCPISNRFAIHNQVIVVSDRNRAAIRAFLMSSFGRCFNFSSIQPHGFGGFLHKALARRCVKFLTGQTLRRSPRCPHDLSIQAQWRIQSGASG